jgi:hypothetical protein
MAVYVGIMLLCLLKSAIKTDDNESQKGSVIKSIITAFLVAENKGFIHLFSAFPILGHS